jgi:hypothetical protein
MAEGESQNLVEGMVIGSLEIGLSAVHSAVDSVLAASVTLVETPMHIASMPLSIFDAFGKIFT